VQAFGPRAVAVPVLVHDARLVALELLCVLIGGLISLHRPGNRVGGLLLAGALALSAFSFLENYFGYAAQHPGVLPDLRAAAWIANGWFVAGLDALLLMVLVYPTGTLSSPRWRPVAWALVAWGLVAVVLSTVQPTLVMAPKIANPVGVHGPAATFVEQVLVAAILPLLFFLPAAVVSLIVRFRRARGQECQQLKWLLYAGALSATATILNNLGVLGAWGGAIDNLIALAVPIAIGIALLRYRLYEIDRLVNRTLVYGLLTILLGGLYAAMVLTLGQLAGRIGADPPSWAVVGATLAVAVLFQPARRRIQQVVDRRFNRHRYDAAKTVEAFSTRLREEIDLDTLAAELLAVVDQTTQPTQASLWLRPPQTPTQQR
jgi:hypothetical protein